METFLHKERMWFGMVMSGVMLSLTVAGEAQAVDGIKLLTGTPPIAIPKPGSYRLKRNITVTDPAVSGIQVGADNVTLDLNGFAVIGRAPCNPTCTPTGTGIGIDAYNSRNVRIRNGTVSGFGGDGVKLGFNSRLENVSAIFNGGSGIYAGGYANTVVGCLSKSNGGDGIFVVYDSIVSDNTVTDNGGDPNPQTTGGVEIGFNRCHAGTSCP